MLLYIHACSNLKGHLSPHSESKPKLCQSLHIGIRIRREPCSRLPIGDARVCELAWRKTFPKEEPRWPWSKFVFPSQQTFAPLVRTRFWREDPWVFDCLEGRVAAKDSFLLEIESLEEASTLAAGAPLEANECLESGIPRDVTDMDERGGAFSWATILARRL